MDLDLWIWIWIYGSRSMDLDLWIWIYGSNRSIWEEEGMSENKSVIDKSDSNMDTDTDMDLWI
jgi:hypothetical protein